MIILLVQIELIELMHFWSMFIMTQFTVHIASGLWIKGFNAVGGLCNLHYFSKSFIFYIAKQQSHLLIVKN